MISWGRTQPSTHPYRSPVGNRVTPVAPVTPVKPMVSSTQKPSSQQPSLSLDQQILNSGVKYNYGKEIGIDDTSNRRVFEQMYSRRDR